MFSYIYQKVVQSPERLMTEIELAGLPRPAYTDTTASSVTLYFENALGSGQEITLEEVVQGHQVQSVDEYIYNSVTEAKRFGLELENGFIIENVKLGITQLNLTNHVRKTLREVRDAISTGSLKDAITELRAINPAALDSTILTSARLLAFRNKIEAWLEVPLAQAWNDEETWL